MSHIMLLESENVKRLRAVRIVPKERGVTLLRGRNEAGKTSVVDSIDYTLGGAKTHPPEVIRLGEQHAKTLIETPELIARRRWWRTEKGIETELEVTAKADGLKLDSPQKVLDKMYEQASDPTSFFRMKKADRLDWLRKVVGVDTTALEKQIQRVFDARTLVGRDLGSATARLKAMLADKPPAPIDTAALLKERGELTTAQAVERQAKAERDAAMRRISDCQDAVRVAEQALAQAKVRLETAMKQAAQADNFADDADEKAAGAAARLVELDAQLQKASAVAMANARWAEREKLVAEVAKLEADSKAKTDEIEKLRSEKETLLANAKFPVEGLGFGEDDVTFKGIPLEQTSGAQRIRIGAQLLIARNPKMRVMRVPNGGDLDEDNIAALDEVCTEADWQCIVEVPGESGPATVVIRDGAVLE